MQHSGLHCCTWHPCCACQAAPPGLQPGAPEGCCCHPHFRLVLHSLFSIVAMSCRPYWAGKPPEWASSGVDETLPPANTAEPSAQALASQGPTMDPRLLRLTQRQGSVPDRRSAREAAVVRRRSPSPEAARAAEVQAAPGAASSRSALRAADQGYGDEEADEDEEAIAARRLAIRRRQMATEAAAAAGPSADEVWMCHVEVACAERFEMRRLAFVGPRASSPHAGPGQVAARGPLHRTWKTAQSTQRRTTVTLTADMYCSSLHSCPKQIVRWAHSPAVHGTSSRTLCYICWWTRQPGECNS